MTTFLLGMICGFIVGGFVMHLVHEYIDSMMTDDDGRWLGRTCPPCDGKCRQGRECPSK